MKKSVTPAKAGVQSGVHVLSPGFRRGDDKAWIPAFAGMTAFILLLSALAFAADPFLPETFDTTYSLPVGGRTWTVNAGDNLQAAIDNASLGDVIVLQAGATFTGNFKLPNKTGTGWLYIFSSELEQMPEGKRVGPADAAHMPKITNAAGEDMALFVDFNAHHYRFSGIEFTTDKPTYYLIWLGFGLAHYSDPLWSLTAATSSDQLPQHITFDRCYIHSTSDSNMLRGGMQGNGRYIAVVDSTIANVKDTADAAAIEIWNGGGPYKIVNNYLEATGENVIFGGTDPAIPNAVPSDIEFRGNMCFKPLYWCATDPSYNGHNWGIKNLFELKNARRVWISGNVFEHNWADAQNGTAILFTVRNQSGTAPWSVLEDITFENNIVRSALRAMTVTGADDIHPPSGQTKRVLIRNNAFLDLSLEWSGGYSGTSAGGIMLATPGNNPLPILDLAISNNFLLFNGQGGPLVSIGGPIPTLTNFVMENNIVTRGNYGLSGENVGEGTVALDTYAPGWVARKNLFISREIDREHSLDLANFARLYPSDNWISDGTSSVGFTDFDNGSYRLTPASPYHNAGIGGKDIGPDWDALDAAIANVGQGPVSPNPPPSNPPPSNPPPSNPPPSNPTLNTPDAEPERNVIHPSIGSEAVISFTCDQPGRVELWIYNRLGPVIELVNGDYGVGTFSVHWDGRNKDGQRVASGIYLVNVKGARAATNKIAVLR